MQPNCLVCRFRMTEMTIESLSVPKRNKSSSSRFRRRLGERRQPVVPHHLPLRNSLLTKLRLEAKRPSKFPSRGPLASHGGGTSDNTAWPTLPYFWSDRPFRTHDSMQGYEGSRDAP